MSQAPMKQVAGKTRNTTKKKPVSVALSTANRTWTVPGMKPGLRDKAKPPVSALHEVPSCSVVPVRQRVWSDGRAQETHPHVPRRIQAHTLKKQI
jgi:hypothetical protein